MAKCSVLDGLFGWWLVTITSLLSRFEFQASFLPMLQPKHPATPGANFHHLAATTTAAHWPPEALQAAG